MGKINPQDIKDIAKAVVNLGTRMTSMELSLGATLRNTGRAKDASESLLVRSNNLAVQVDKMMDAVKAIPVVMTPERSNGQAQLDLPDPKKDRPLLPPRSLKDLRIGLGWSQRHAAELLSLNHSAICLIEKGHIGVTGESRVENHEGYRELLEQEHGIRFGIRFEAWDNPQEVATRSGDCDGCGNAFEYTGRKRRFCEYPGCGNRYHGRRRACKTMGENPDSKKGKIWIQLTEKRHRLVQEAKSNE